MSSSSSSKYNAVDYLILSEFDIDSGSTVRHIYPDLPSGYERDWFANYMLPEGVHNRSLDSTFMILNRRDRYLYEEKWVYPYSDTSFSNSNNNNNNNNSDSSDNYLLYGLNLVKTEYDSNVRRGAIVKAIAIFSKYHFVNIFRSPLSKALDLYFASPKAGETVLKDLYDSLNTLPMNDIPVWNEIQRALAVRWMGVSGYSVIAREREMRGSVHHVIGPKYYDLNLNYAGINFTLNAPLYRSPDQVGDGSISKLVSLFGADVMKIYNAVLARKRVLFVGYGMAAMDIAALVLATVQLVSPPLVGVIRRAFPYATITDLSFLETEGYIAGVTNPMFSNHEEWWDVLCSLDLNENTNCGYTGGAIGGSATVGAVMATSTSSHSSTSSSSQSNHPPSNSNHSDSINKEADIVETASAIDPLENSNLRTPDSKSKTRGREMVLDIPGIPETSSSSTSTGGYMTPTPTSPSNMYSPAHPKAFKQFRGDDYRATVVISGALESQSQLSLQALAISSASAVSKSKSRTNNKSRKYPSTNIGVRDNFHRRGVESDAEMTVKSSTGEGGKDGDNADTATTNDSWAQTQSWLASTFTAFTADDVRFSNRVLAGLGVDSKRLGEDWLRQEFRDYTTDRLERALRLGLGRSHSSSFVSDSASPSSSTSAPSSVTSDGGITPDSDTSEISDDRKTSSSSLASSPAERLSQVSMPIPMGVTSPKSKKSFLRRSDPSRVGSVTLELERGTQAAQLLESPEVQNMACDPWLWAHQLDTNVDKDNSDFKINITDSSGDAMKDGMEYGENGLRLRQYVRILQGKHFSSSANASDAINADFLFLGPVVDIVGEGAQAVTTAATAAGIGIGVGLGLVPQDQAQSEVNADSATTTTTTTSNNNNNNNGISIATERIAPDKALVEHESSTYTSTDTSTTTKNNGSLSSTTIATRVGSVSGSWSGNTVDMFVALEKATRTRGGCMALVSLLPESVGGLSCIAIGMYHASTVAAEAAVKILEHCECHEETKMAVMCLSPLLLAARSNLIEDIHGKAEVEFEVEDEVANQSPTSCSENRSRSSSASSTTSSSIVKLIPTKTFLHPN